MRGRSRLDGKARAPFLTAALGIGALVVVAWSLERPIVEHFELANLASDDRTKWKDAARELADLRSARAIPRLVEILADPELADPADRRFYTEMLVKIGPAAIPALLDTLKSQDRTLRGLTDDALVAIATGERAQDTVPFFVAKLCDRRRDACLRKYSSGMLGVIGPGSEPAVPALIELFEDPSEESSIRWHVASTLGRIGPGAGAAVPVLTAALDDDDEEIREIVAGALRDIRGPGENGR